MRAENEKLRAKIDALLNKSCILLQQTTNSSKEYCAIANTVQDALYTIDPTGVILSLNPAWEKITGFKGEDWIGKTFAPLVHPDDLAHVTEHFGRAIAGETPPQYEARFITQSGQYKFGHFANAPHLCNNKVTAVVGVARDITELKHQEETRLRLERKMQESQKLESLGVLAGGIAHDLNNLLMGILGNADLALVNAEKGKPVQARLEDIKLTAIRLSDLTNQMLAYSGKGNFTVETIHLSDVVKEMARLLEVSLPKKATIHIDLMTDIPLMNADVSQLQQVILNLLTNAAESRTDDQVTVSVRTALFTVDQVWLTEAIADSQFQEGEYILLEVSDTGFGMDELTQKKIFDPFFTTKFTGRGLGLAAVLGIVRSHRGAIRVSSTPNQGSCFQILFPKSEDLAKKSMPDLKRNSSIPKRQGTILLVDDDPIVLNITSLMLKEAGFKVVTAKDGIEAVATVEKNKNTFDAVLLDMTMPRMDGIEAFARIRKICPNLKVILSSGYNEHETCQRLEDLKTDGFLKKPYQLYNLMDILGKILDSESLNS